MTRREFAADTSVSVLKSKLEIEALLTKHGAEGFQTGWQQAKGDDPGWDVVGFMWKGKSLRFRLDRPRPWTDTPRADGKDGSVRHFAEWAKSRYGVLSGTKLAEAIEQRNRQRWRLLCLVIKAKLEAVQAGVVEFEEEFLPFIVMDGGQTIGEIILPRIQAGNMRLQLEAGAQR